MTLEEAIKRCEEAAEAIDAGIENAEIAGFAINYFECEEFASEHRQLAEWLKELKERRAQDVPGTNKAAKRLNDLIFDINPAEICSQIKSDNLKHWCEIIQTEMKMAMVQLLCWGGGEADGQTNRR